MKAIVQIAYGGPDVYRIADRPKPQPTRPDDVLVRVRAASLHPDVWHVMTGTPYLLRIMGAGLVRPKQPIPGTDMAGLVEAVGDQVTRFRPGDRVFGETLEGHQWQNAGAFAEYVVVRERSLALIPERISFEHAATLPTAGFIAHQVVVGEGQVKAGQQVLINGAGGGVGSLAVQLARAMGAVVTAVDHPSKHALLRSLGVERTIDYLTEDFADGSKQYDVIIDVPFNRPFSEHRKALTPDGVYVAVGHDHYGRTRKRWLGAVPAALGLVFRSFFCRQLPGIRGALPAPNRLETLRALLESGKITSTVARCFPLQEVADAMRCLIGGEHPGRIVLVIPQTDAPLSDVP